MPLPKPANAGISSEYYRNSLTMTFFKWGAIKLRRVYFYYQYLKSNKCSGAMGCCSSRPFLAIHFYQQWVGYQLLCRWRFYIGDNLTEEFDLNDIFEINKCIGDFPFDIGDPKWQNASPMSYWPYHTPNSIWDERCWWQVWHMANIEHLLNKIRN